MLVEVRGQCPQLQAWDMQTSLHFWRELLGFDLVRSAGPPDDIGWAWLRRGSAEIMLNTQYEMPKREAAHEDTCRLRRWPRTE